MFATQYAPVPTMADQPSHNHTPIHTPQHSLSSTKSHTPGGRALSIHEYRRQQATPPSPPSASSSARRLRRRRAASGLNSLRTTSASLTAQTKAQTRPEYSDTLQSLLPAQYFDGPTSFFPHIPPPSLVSASPASQRHTGRSKRRSLFSATGRVDDTSQTGEKTHNFNTIKHLPHRQAPELEQVYATIAVSPSPSPKNSSLPDGRPSTSSPTVSLSRFPHPPQRRDASSLAPAAQERSQPQQLAHLAPPPASPVQPPRSAPPTVLHYRGASFDLVNPHRSLLLSAIETPDQRNSDQIDYFRPKLESGTALQTDMSTHDGNEIELAERPTPSRTLYNDLSAAHEAIATRSVRSVKSLQSLRDEYRKPGANHEADSLRGRVKAPLTALPHRERAPDQSKPMRSASVRDRLSRAWRRGIDSFRVMDHAVTEQGGEIATIEEQRAMAGIPDPIYSEPGLFATLEPSFEPRHLKRISASMGDLSQGHPAYDAESNYASSTWLQDDRQSFGYPPSIIDNRQSIPYGRMTGQTDYSDSVGDIHSYVYGYASRDSGRLSSPLRTQGGRLSSNKGSTIDNILDRYHEADVSDTSLDQLADDEGDVVHVSARDLEPFPAPEDSTTTLATRISSNQSSTAPSPRTPDAYAFQPHHVFTSSENPPPLRALPPPVQYLPPFAPGFGHEPSGFSDTTSGQTYGDTRELLMLSQSLFDGGASMERRRTASEAASASSEALAGEDLLDDRASPETALRASPLHSQPFNSGDPAFDGDADRQSDVAPSRMSPTTDHLSSALPHRVADVLTTDRHGADTSEERATTDTEINFEGSPEVEIPRRAPSTTSPLSQRSSGVPRMWTGSPPRMAVPEDGSNWKHHSASADSYADVEDEDCPVTVVDEDNEDDWETIAAQSRQTLPPQQTLSSMADYSDASFVASYGMLPSAKYLDGHHRSSSRYSDDPRSSAHGSVTPTVPLFNSASPKTSQAADSAASHSEARQLSKPIGNTAASPHSMTSDPQLPLAVYGDEKDVQDKVKGKQRAQEGHEVLTALHTESARDWQGARSWTTEEYFPQTDGVHTMSRLLSSGPNDDILYDGQSMLDHGMSASAVLSSPEPATQSVIVHEDSFSKLVVLGPKANLTGTPQGTNMREVGSSLANTSSPSDPMWSSTPVRPFTSSPPVGSPEMDEGDDVESPSMRIKNRPGTPGPKSPKSPRTPKSPRFPVLPVLSRLSKTDKTDEAESAPPAIIIPKTSREHIETGNLIDLREQKRREREERELARARAKSAKRASVTGQTELREMQLVRDHQHSPTEQRAATASPVGSHHTHAVSQRKGSVTPTTQYSNYAQHTDGNSTTAAGRDSSDTGSPLFDPPDYARNAADYLRQQADINNQHLLNIPPAPLTADLIAKQQLVSWLLFGCAALLPPLLVLYRWEADPVICWVTNGKILSASARPKRLAPWVGIGLSVAILVAAIIVVVLWRVGIIL